MDFIKKNLYHEFEIDNKLKIIFTNRNTGDMAFQGEEKNFEKILKNRKLLASKLDYNIDDFIFAQQFHTNNISEVKKKDKGRGHLAFDDGIKNVDGLFTFEKNIVLSTFHADCTPIYIYSLEDNFISILHSGWQGTMKEITYLSLKYYINNLNLNINNIKVIIGPSINKETFEVEIDVINELNKIVYIEKKSCYEDLGNGKFLLDVKKVNKLQAIAAGIKNENIFISKINTHSNENFYSYRENKDTERMIACIVQK